MGETARILMVESKEYIQLCSDHDYIFLLKTEWIEKYILIIKRLLCKIIHSLICLMHKLNYAV